MRKKICPEYLNTTTKITYFMSHLSKIFVPAAQKYREKYVFSQNRTLKMSGKTLKNTENNLENP